MSLPARDPMAIYIVLDPVAWDAGTWLYPNGTVHTDIAQARTLTSGDKLAKFANEHWTEAAEDLGGGVTLYQLNIPADMRAAGVTGPLTFDAMMVVWDMDRLLALGTAGIEAEATEKMVDLTGLTTDREKALALVYFGTPSVAVDPQTTTAASLRTQLEGGTWLECRRWCALHDVDILDVKTAYDASSITLPQALTQAADKAIPQLGLS